MQLRKPNLKKIKIRETSNVCKKVYFGTKEIADAFIKKRSWEKNARPATSYLCHKCNCWHLTSWESPDVERFIKEIQSDIDILDEEYTRQYENDCKHIEFCLKQIQDYEIASNNMLRENKKLREELELLKFLTKGV
ncbi:MAG: hypothetical protein ACOYOV_18145 [Bacteroidales bacterium]